MLGTWSHPLLTQLDLRTAEAEILGGFESLEDIIDDVPAFFRFPYGSRNLPLQEFVRSIGVATFF